MPEIRHRVGISAPVGKVYAVLTTVEGARSWWDASAKGDAKLGGFITLFEAVDLEVVEARRDELVRWKCVRGPSEWMDTEVIFQLARKQDQTFVLFTHAGWKDPGEFMHHCSTKWAIFLVHGLKAFLETGKGRPAPHDVQVYVGG